MKDREAWHAAVHGVTKSQTQLSDWTTTELLMDFPGIPVSGTEYTCQWRRHGLDLWVGKTPLEEEMAAHSSNLAREIPWTEEPGGLQSMGSQRVEHVFGTKQQQQCSIIWIYYSVFIYLHIERYLGCFWVWFWVMNKSAINICVQILLTCKFLTHLSI